jgi:hypothetical protein
VPSRIGRPEMLPVKRKRFAPLLAGTSSRPASRQTGATCLNRIATRPAAEARKASTRLGRRFAVSRRDDGWEAGLAPVEL